MQMPDILSYLLAKSMIDNQSCRLMEPYRSTDYETVSDYHIYTRNIIIDRLGVRNWAGFWRLPVKCRICYPACRCCVHPVVAIGKASVERSKHAQSGQRCFITGACGHRCLYPGLSVVVYRAALNRIAIIVRFRCTGGGVPVYISAGSDSKIAVQRFGQGGRRRHCP